MKDDEELGRAMAESLRQKQVEQQRDIKLYEEQKQQAIAASMKEVHYHEAFVKAAELRGFTVWVDLLMILALFSIFLYTILILYLYLVHFTTLVDLITDC